MKIICFIFCGDLYLCPYLKYYLNTLSINYDIICWNRDSNENYDQNNIFAFHKEVISNNKLKKLYGYILFRKYCKDILKKNKYVGVVVLNTITSLIIGNYLKKKFKKKYIIDISEYSGVAEPCFPLKEPPNIPVKRANLSANESQ